MKITISLLNKIFACSDQQKLFCRVFPLGTTVTLRSLARARKHDLSVHWFCHTMLSDSANARYGTRTTAAYQRYVKVRDAAWETYDKTLGILDAEGVNPRAVAQEKYGKITDAAWKTYCAVCDRVLVALLKNPANLKPELRDLEK